MRLAGSSLKHVVTILDDTLLPSVGISVVLPYMLCVTVSQVIFFPGWQRHHPFFFSDWLVLVAFFWLYLFG